MPVPPASPSITVVVTVAGACAMGLIGWRLGGEPDRPAANPPTQVVIEVGARADDRFVVHVVGMVANPGLVTVPQGARVADAVIAAGGMLPGASVGSINLASPVVDGEQIVIGSVASTNPAGGEEPRVAINSATADELEALPGVGPVLAARITAYREEHGPFQDVEDLLAVTGIGERMLASLRDLVRVP